MEDSFDINLNLNGESGTSDNNLGEAITNLNKQMMSLEKTMSTMLKSNAKIVSTAIKNASVAQTKLQIQQEKTQTTTQQILKQKLKNKDPVIEVNKLRAEVAKERVINDRNKGKIAKEEATAYSKKKDADVRLVETKIKQIDAGIKSTKETAQTLKKSLDNKYAYANKISQLKVNEFASKNEAKLAYLNSPAQQQIAGTRQLNAEARHTNAQAKIARILQVNSLLDLSNEYASQGNTKKAEQFKQLYADAVAKGTVRGLKDSSVRSIFSAVGAGLVLQGINNITSAYGRSTNLGVNIASSVMSNNPIASGFANVGSTYNAVTNLALQQKYGKYQSLSSVIGMGAGALVGGILTGGIGATIGAGVGSTVSNMGWQFLPGSGNQAMVQKQMQNQAVSIGVQNAINSSIMQNTAPRAYQALTSMAPYDPSKNKSANFLADTPLAQAVAKTATRFLKNPSAQWINNLTTYMKATGVTAGEVDTKLGSMLQNYLRSGGSLQALSDLSARTGLDASQITDRINPYAQGGMSVSQAAIMASRSYQQSPGFTAFQNSFYTGSFTSRSLRDYIGKNILGVNLEKFALGGNGGVGKLFKSASKFGTLESILAGTKLDLLGIDQGGRNIYPVTDFTKQKGGIKPTAIQNKVENVENETTIKASRGGINIDDTTQSFQDLNRAIQTTTTNINKLNSNILNRGGTSSAIGAR